MGVSGEAHGGGGSGHVLVTYVQRQSPSWQATFTPHVLVKQVVPDGRVQGVPSLGTTEGQGERRAGAGLQSQSCVPLGDPLQLGTHPGWLQQQVHTLQVHALPSG
jgi:hypothetical protein